HYSFFLTGSTTTQTYTLSLHDALPIYSAYFPFHGFNNDPPWGRLGGSHSDRSRSSHPSRVGLPSPTPRRIPATQLEHRQAPLALDRKSTRLNSSHVKISYAVFCLKKKK